MEANKVITTVARDLAIYKVSSSMLRCLTSQDSYLPIQYTAGQPLIRPLYFQA